jgi:uncharacterized SAM-binding protein YcdF (DUF218 family)
MKIICISVILILIATGVFTCRRAGSFLVREETSEHADAMIILMGSMYDRTLEAIDLINKKTTNRILIVEDNKDIGEGLKFKGLVLISDSEQVSKNLLSSGFPEKNLTLLRGYSRSTLDEALITCDFLRNNNTIDTLLIVTSSSHSRRATLIFRNVFQKAGIEAFIACSPNPYTEFNSKKWWKKKEDIQIVLSEYLKLASFILFEKHSL